MEYRRNSLFDSDTESELSDDLPSESSRASRCSLSPSSSGSTSDDSSSSGSRINWPHSSESDDDTDEDDDITFVSPVTKCYCKIKDYLFKKSNGRKLTRKITKYIYSNIMNNNKLMKELTPICINCQSEIDSLDRSCNNPLKKSGHNNYTIRVEKVTAEMRKKYDILKKCQLICVWCKMQVTRGRSVVDSVDKSHSQVAKKKAVPAQNKILMKARRKLERMELNEKKVKKAIMQLVLKPQVCLVKHYENVNYQETSNGSSVQITEIENQVESEIVVKDSKKDNKKILCYQERTVPELDDFLFGKTPLPNINLKKNFNISINLKRKTYLEKEFESDENFNNVALEEKTEDDENQLVIDEETTSDNSSIEKIENYVEIKKEENQNDICKENFNKLVKELKKTTLACTIEKTKETEESITQQTKMPEVMIDITTEPEKCEDDSNIVADARSEKTILDNCIEERKENENIIEEHSEIDEVTNNNIAKSAKDQSSEVKIPGILDNDDLDSNEDNSTLEFLKADATKNKGYITEGKTVESTTKRTAMEDIEKILSMMETGLDHCTDSLDTIIEKDDDVDKVSIASQDTIIDVNLHNSNHEFSEKNSPLHDLNDLNDLEEGDMDYMLVYNSAVSSHSSEAESHQTDQKLSINDKENDLDRTKNSVAIVKPFQNHLERNLTELNGEEIKNRSPKPLQQKEMAKKRKNFNDAQSKSPKKCKLEVQEQREISKSSQLKGLTFSENIQVLKSTEVKRPKIGPKFTKSAEYISSEKSKENKFTNTQNKILMKRHKIGPKFTKTAEYISSEKSKENIPENQEIINTQNLQVNINSSHNSSTENSFKDNIAESSNQNPQQPDKRKHKTLNLRSYNSLLSMIVIDQLENTADDNKEVVQQENDEIPKEEPAVEISFSSSGLIEDIKFNEMNENSNILSNNDSEIRIADIESVVPLTPAVKKREKYFTLQDLQKLNLFLEDTAPEGVYNPSGENCSENQKNTDFLKYFMEKSLENTSDITGNEFIDFSEIDLNGKVIAKYSENITLTHQFSKHDPMPETENLSVTSEKLAAVSTNSSSINSNYIKLYSTYIVLLSLKNIDFKKTYDKVSGDLYPDAICKQRALLNLGYIVQSLESSNGSVSKNFLNYLSFKINDSINETYGQGDHYFTSKEELKEMVDEYKELLQMIRPYFTIENYSTFLKQAYEFAKLCDPNIFASLINIGNETRPRKLPKIRPLHPQINVDQNTDNSGMNIHLSNANIESVNSDDEIEVIAVIQKTMSENHSINCVFCNKENASVFCNVCRAASYCSNDCRNQHMPLHKAVCNIADVKPNCSRKMLK